MQRRRVCISMWFGRRPVATRTEALAIRGERVDLLQRQHAPLYRADKAREERLLEEHACGGSSARGQPLEETHAQQAPCLLGVTLALVVVALALVLQSLLLLCLLRAGAAHAIIRALLKPVALRCCRRLPLCVGGRG